MTITAEQKTARMKWIGSSDAPAILGVDPWRSAREVFWSKVLRTTDYTTPAMDVGNYTEAGTLAWLTDRLGVTLERDVSLQDGVLGCNLDARISPTEIVEAKASSRPDGWGDPGSGEVPPHVLVQVSHAMAVSGAEVCWVPVLAAWWGRFAYKLYRVDRDDAIVDGVADACRTFWSDHVVPQIEPPGTPPALGFLKRVIRDEGSGVVVPIDYCHAEAIGTAKDATRRAKTLEDECKAEVISALGPHERGKAVWDNGEHAALEERPDIDITYLPDKNGRRTLRVKTNGANR